jgi:hypothetical protein
MVDISKIKSAFQGFIGVHQTGSALPKIDSDLLASQDSLLISDIHPFFTHENIFHCVNGLDEYDKKTQEVRAFDNATLYRVGELCQSNSKVYRCIKNTINAIAVTNQEYFKETNLYSNYIRRKLDYVCSETVRTVLDRRVGYNAKGKNVVSNLLVYDGRGTTDTILKRGRFVGFKVIVVRPNMKFQLHRIALQLSEAQELGIYIFQANNPEPIFIQTVNYTTPFKMAEFSIPDIIFESDIVGNEFIVGYYEEDLVGYAIQRDIDVVSPKVGCCNNLSYSYYQKFSKFVDIKPFYVEEDFLDARELSWSNKEEMVINGNNFGLNMNFTVKCDVTDLLIQQRQLFKNVIQQMLVVSILKDLINSNRVNAIADNVRGLVLSNGTIQGFVKTEEDRLTKRIETISIDLTSLDSVCMPNTTQKFRTKTGSI